MIETPKPIRAHYLILRRNTGELVLSTEADISHGYGESGPSVHSKYGCYAQQPGPKKLAPAHKIRSYLGGDEADCPCACHTRKGVAAHAVKLAEFTARQKDPGGRKYEFEGGSSMGVNLARRVRRVSPDKQRRLQQLDAKIAKLQRERTAIIPALWGDSDVLTAIDLAKIAATPQAKKGPGRRLVESALEAKNTISPEGKPR